MRFFKNEGNSPCTTCQRRRAAQDDGIKRRLAKATGSLTAISGDMPRFPFTSSESVLRATSRAA
jgi:hypothetical protein